MLKCLMDYSDYSPKDNSTQGLILNVRIYGKAIFHLLLSKNQNKTLLSFNILLLLDFYIKKENKY